MKWVKAVAVMGVALALNACDWGPRGPGQLEGIVTSGSVPVGAVVLEISGPGVQEFTGAGQTRVFFAEPDSAVYRVVLVTANPGRLKFRVTMDDVRGSPLTVSTVQAVDGSNARITDLSGIAVEIAR